MLCQGLSGKKRCYVAKSKVIILKTGPVSFLYEEDGNTVITTDKEPVSTAVNSGWSK